MPWMTVDKKTATRDNDMLVMKKSRNGEGIGSRTGSTRLATRGNRYLDTSAITIRRFCQSGRWLEQFLLQIVTPSSYQTV